ncbi:MAG: YhjD/YihY/BrkB family envelope integrity protein, partial [Duodenibacillus sp.]
FVPNTRVSMVHALVGGLTVVVISQLVREGFAMFVTFGTMTTVYGAFAAIPVLILWIYIGWFLFFAGAAVTATIPKLTAGRMQDGLTQGNDFLTSLVMLRALVERSQRGKNPVLTVDELCDAADTYPAFVERNMGLLERAGYVANATLEKKAGQSCWALVTDPAKATLRPAFEVFAVSGDNSLVRNRGKSRTEAPLLEDWWRTLSSSPALTTPLTELWARKDG